MAKNTKPKNKANKPASESNTYEFIESLSGAKVQVVYADDINTLYNQLITNYPFLKENKRAQRFMKTRYNSNSNKSLYSGVCVYNLDAVRTIFILIDNKAHFATLAHEAIHAMDAIMEYFGFEGTEFRAYGSGAIIKAVYPQG
jgi:predicted house-cleaning NTP pyrophosphatase (Maf/HAM1 superfamily)